MKLSNCLLSFIIKAMWVVYECGCQMWTKKMLLMWKDGPQEGATASLSFKEKIEGLCIQSRMLKHTDGIFRPGSLALCQACALQGADPDLHHETVRRCIVGFSPCFWQAVAQEASWFFRDDSRTGQTPHGSLTVFLTRWDRKYWKIRP